MSAKHRETLKQLFEHPVVVNIDWWKIEHLFEALGAQVETTTNDRLKVFLNGQEYTFHRPHHKHVSDKDEVLTIRHFLERAEIYPDYFS